MKLLGSFLSSYHLARAGLVLILLLSVGLNNCGLKGDLYVPPTDDQETQNQ